MSTVEDEGALPAARPPKARRRGLRRILLALLTQYFMIATLVGLTVAVTLHCLVTPQVVGTIADLEAAFNRLPPR